MGLACAGLGAVVWLLLTASSAGAAPAAGDSDAPTGTMWVECRNERQGALDHHGRRLVPTDAPAWWLEEVRQESQDIRTGFEGRGETESHSDDTRNLGAEGCSLAESPPDERTCEEINEQKASLRAGEEAGTLTGAQAEILEDLEWLGSSIVPDGCWGTYPTSHYDLTWDARGVLSFDGWTDRFTGWVSSLLFGLGKLAVRVMLWLVSFAFLFDVDEYRTTVAELAGDLDSQLVHLGGGQDLTLLTLAFFALFAVAGFQALRGRLGRAGAEIATSVVLAALASVLMGAVFRPLPADTGDAPAYAPGGYMDSAADLVERSSLAPLLAADGRSPNEDLDRSGVEDLLRDSQGGLHEEFVEAPYYFINWNKDRHELADEPGGGGSRSCADIQDDILSVRDKPTGWPSRYMARHGCLAEAEFNSSIGATRFAGIVLVMVVAMFVSVVVGMAAVMLLFAKFLLALLFAALPLVAVAALLPGAGRRLAWGWLGSLAQLWLTAIVAGLVIMLLLFGVEAIRFTTGSLQLVERWVTVLATVGVIYVARKRMAAGTRRVARRISGGLERIAGAAEGRVWQRRYEATASWAGGPLALAGGEGPAEVDLPWSEPVAAPGPQAADRPSGGGEGAGGFDLQQAEDTTARTAAGVGAAGAGAAGWAAGLAGGAAGWTVGGVRRTAVQRAEENRWQSKNGTRRAAMIDWETLYDSNLKAAKAGDPPYLPGDGGRRSPHPVPSATQIRQGTWRIRVARGRRLVRRGNFTPYGGERGRVVSYRWGWFGRPQYVKRGDGGWNRVRRPRWRPVSRSMRRDGRRFHDLTIRGYRRRDGW